MSFLSPIAGLVAGGMGGLLVMLFWMLRLRRHQVKVSSTMLWKQSVRDLEGNIPWQRVRLTGLLLLQLLAVMLLAVAIANPVHDGGVSVGGEVVIIVDAGASMGAVIDRDGTTRLDRAKRDAGALIQQIGRGSSARFRVIQAGREARIVSGSAGTWRLALAAIEGIVQSDARGDLEEAVELSRALGTDEYVEEQDVGSPSESGRSVFVFSDGSVEGARVIRPSGGETTGRGNLGIVLVGGQRDQVDSDRCRLFVTIAGVVDGTVGTTLRARVDNAVVSSRAIGFDESVDGIVEATGTLEFVMPMAGLVEVSISREDVLMSDNRVWVMMPSPVPVVTTVVGPSGGADPLLIDVLRAATGGRVEAVGVGESVLSGTGLIVYDRVPPDPHVKLPTIVVGGDGEEIADRRGEIHGLVTWDRSHPVMRDVDLGGLRFVNASVVDGDSLASGIDGAVIGGSAVAGVRRLEIGFSISDSNWGMQVSMPMFFENAVRFLLPGSSGTGTVYRSREPIGESRELVERVGLVEVDGALVGVSLLDREATIRAGRVIDLSADPEPGPGSDPAWGAGGEGRVELWRWFVLAGLGVMSFEWVVDLIRRRNVLS